MSFWIVSLTIAALVAASLALALLRGRGGRAAGPAQDVQVYKDQLAEVERDLARGVMSEDEAGRSRVEVSRRLLEAARGAEAAGVTGGGQANPVIAWGLGLAVLAGAFGIYSQLGAPKYPDLPLERRIAAAEDFRASRIDQAAAEAQIGAVQIDPNADPAHVELMVKLRAALKDRPDDLAGHELLARNEAALGDFIAARKAQARVLELKGDAATGEDYADYAYVQIAAAGGYVSPQAEAALSNALQRDPKNRLARFYSGVMFAQVGRPDMTFRLWRPLLDDAPTDDPFAPAIRDQIEDIAAEAGVRFSLPETAGPRGPSAADVAAASEMSAEDRQGMIRGMVEGLSDRLATEGGPPEDWARLITALGVLGETDRAAAIWTEAQQVFAQAPEALASLRSAAKQAGVAQ
ncbi:MAG: c-type cytochrome biogenesis protein CcmI [Paracoccaceae bacterium]